MADFIEKTQDKEKKVIYKGFYEDSADMRAIHVEEGIEEIAENAFRDI